MMDLTDCGTRKSCFSQQETWLAVARGMSVTRKSTARSVSDVRVQSRNSEWMDEETND